MWSDFSPLIRKGLISISFCILGFTPGGFGQAVTQAQNQASSGPASTYSVNLEVELLENERNTEQSNNSDVYQKKSQKKGAADLSFYMFHLDGSYKEYNSIVKVDTDQSEIDEVRDNLAAWVELFRFFYVFGQSKNLMFQYQYSSNSASQFYEQEKARALTQGLGFRLNEWRLGIAPQSRFFWTFDVEVLDQSIISESVQFDLNVFEIIKRATDKEGFYYEVGLKQWTSKEALEGRQGKLENQDAFLILGMGISEDSVLFLGEEVSRGKIETTLQSDKSLVTRVSDSGKFQFGFEVGFVEDSAIYIQKQLQHGKIELENVSFSKQKNAFEDSVSFGIRFNRRLALELNMTKTIVEEFYTINVPTSQTASFRQSDNLIGISMELTFSD